MTLFSRRLPHVLTRADLARVVTPTYAAAMGVEEDEAHERVKRAVEAPGVADDLYRGISAALASSKGPRTTEDAQLDKLSAAVVARRARVKPAPSSAAVSAVLVRMNLDIGLAPEGMRTTLASEKGRAMLEEGLRTLGAHLVKELMKG